MVSIYGRIWYIARKQRNKVHAQQQQQLSGSVVSSPKKTDTNKTVLIILCSYVGLYLPNTFVAIMFMVDEANNQFMPVFLILSMGCVLANSGVNVFIYALFTRDFRSVFSVLFGCGGRKRDVDRVSTITPKDTHSSSIDM
jgi:hypothetical protein